VFSAFKQKLHLVPVILKSAIAVSTVQKSVRDVRKSGFRTGRDWGQTTVSYGQYTSI
jgi:hypothetical protein